MPPRPPSANTTIDTHEFQVYYFGTDPQDDAYRLSFDTSGLTIKRNGKTLGTWVYEPEEKTTVKDSDFEEVFS